MPFLPFKNLPIRYFKIDVFKKKTFKILQYFENTVYSTALTYRGTFTENCLETETDFVESYACIGSEYTKCIKVLD